MGAPREPTSARAPALPPPTRAHPVQPRDALAYRLPRLLLLGVQRFEEQPLAAVAGRLLLPRLQVRLVSLRAAAKGVCNVSAMKRKGKSSSHTASARRTQGHQAGTWPKLCGARVLAGSKRQRAYLRLPVMGLGTPGGGERDNTFSAVPNGQWPQPTCTWRLMRAMSASTSSKAAMASDCRAGRRGGRGRPGGYMRGSKAGRWRERGITRTFMMHTNGKRKPCMDGRACQGRTVRALCPGLHAQPGLQLQNDFLCARQLAGVAT